MNKLRYKKFSPPFILIAVFITGVLILFASRSQSDLSYASDKFSVDVIERENKIETKFESGGAGITFGINASGAKTRQDGKKVVYDISDDVAIEYEAIESGESTGIKETIILSSNSAPSEYSFDLKLENVSDYLPNPEDRSWRFYNNEGQEAFYIPAGFMVDAAGARSEDVSISISENGSNYTLTVTADEEWLTDPNRSFPIYIDPSVVVSGGISEGDVSFGSLQRKIVYANGAWYAFYSDGGSVYYKKSSDGASWGSAQDIDSADTDNYNPTVWLEGDDIYVAWIDDSAEAIEINTIETDNSDTLGTKCTSSSLGSIGSTFMVSIAVADDGTVYVAYSDTSSDTEFGVYELTYSGCTFTNIGAEEDTVNIDADFDSDAESDGDQFETETNIFASSWGGVFSRVQLRFPLTSIPTGATITDSDLQYNVNQALVDGGETLDVYAYNSTGDDDPDSDDGATKYSRSVSGSVLTTMDAGSTGSKTGDLGSAADALIQGNIDSPDIFSIGIGIGDLENTEENRIEAIENAGSDPATLTVVYEISSSGLVAGGRPVLVTTGNDLHMIFQDGDLSHSIYDGTSWGESGTTDIDVEFDSYAELGSAYAEQESLTYIFIRENATGEDQERRLGQLRFPLSSIPTGATITNSELQINKTSTSGITSGEDLEVYAYDGTGDDDPDTDDAETKYTSSEVGSILTTLTGLGTGSVTGDLGSAADILIQGNIDSPDIFSISIGPDGDWENADAVFIEATEDAGSDPATLTVSYTLGTINETIASVTDSNYSVTTDGTNVWVLSATDSEDGTNFYSYDGSWTTEESPWSGASIDTPTAIDDAGDPGSPSGMGKQIVRASTGDIYVAIFDSSECEIWKSSDGSSWSEVDSSDNPACIGGPAIAIDSNDDIHMIYTTSLSNLYYVELSSDNFGTPELAQNTASSGYGTLDIAIDSNDVPHVLIQPATFIDSSIMYDNRVGGDWNADVSIQTGLFGSESVSIAINEDDIPEIAFSDNTGGPDLKARLGNQNDATSFSAHTVDSSIASGASIVVDSSGNTWLGYVDSSNDVTIIRHNDSDGWTTWQSAATNSNEGSNPTLAADGGNIYVFYEDENDDIVLDIYNGSTWEGETVIAAGTFAQEVKVRSSLLNNPAYSTYGFDLIYSDGTDIYWNNYSFGTTNLTSASLTYDAGNDDLYVAVIKDESEQAYFKSSDAGTKSWGAETSFEFTAGDLGGLSTPLIVSSLDEISALLRQGENLEFSAGPETPTPEPESIDIEIRGGTDFGGGVTFQ